jgi:hypothetical protein
VKSLKFGPGETKDWIVDCVFPTAGLEAGDYEAVVSLERKGGQVLSSRQHVLRRWPDSFQPKVRIDERRRLIVGGKPFFPLGMYTGGMDDGAMRRYAEGGPFNCLIIYGSPPKEMLDRAARHNLKVRSTTIFSAGNNAPKTLQRRPRNSPPSASGSATSASIRPSLDGTSTTSCRRTSLTG